VHHVRVHASRPLYAPLRFDNAIRDTKSETVTTVTLLVRLFDVYVRASREHRITDTCIYGARRVRHKIDDKYLLRSAYRLSRNGFANFPPKRIEEARPSPVLSA